MSLSWSALHAHLLRSTTRLTAQEAYRSIRETTTGTLPPGDIGALLAFLHAPDGEPAAKNEALRVVIAAAKARPDFAATSTAIIILALWPGLDALRSRLRRRYRCAPADIGGELTGLLAKGIREIDLDRVTRIAATLLRNVERDFIRGRLRRSREMPPGCPVEDLLDGVASVPMFASHAPVAETCTALLERDLANILGEDARLVMAVAVHGFSQREAAEGLGLRHDAARKRYQRACARLRQAWS